MSSIAGLGPWGHKPSFIPLQIYVPARKLVGLGKEILHRKGKWEGLELKVVFCFDFAVEALRSVEGVDRAKAIHGSAFGIGLFLGCIAFGVVRWD